jgi:hypothetical protein
VGQYDVVVGAGSLRSANPAAVTFPHRWTDAGVTVEAPFTGAHLLHLAAAGCVLNDVYREAVALDIPIDGVRVVAEGDYDVDTWASTGIRYAVEVDSEVEAYRIRELLDRVDDVAEIPKAIRQGGEVVRAAPVIDTE